MDKAMRTILEALADTISDLKFAISTKDYQIQTLKEEIAKLKGELDI